MRIVRQLACALKRCAWYGSIVLLALLPVACGDSPAEISEPQVPAHLNVLFIGNSYTFFNDMPGIFQQLTEAAGKGRSVNVDMVAEPSYSLMMHWQNEAALDAIRTDAYDVVVLQESSRGPLTGPTRFQEYAGKLNDEIRAHGANTVFFITWALQSAPEEQQAITDAYVAVAEKLHARVAPVGPAWQNALRADATLQLYDIDGSHPAPLGSYLAAAVFYATLFRESPESPSATPVQQMLQRIAWQTCQQYR